MSLLSGWIDTFSPTIRKNFGFIKGAMYQGLSVNKTIDLLKLSGPAGKRSEIQRMARDILASKRDVNTFLDQANPRAKPNPDLIPPALGRQERTYSYLVEYKAKSSITGFNLREQLTIGSSSLLSVEQIHDMMNEAANPYGYVDEVYQDSFDIKEIHYSDDPVLIG